MAAPKIPNWQAVFLKAVGAPVTPANVRFADAWAQAEGGDATNNPFNTTQPAAGASSYNSVGVRNYGTPEQGIQATAQTLLNGRYGNILAALKQGTDPVAAAHALANSPWGTGSLVLKVLGAGGGAGPSPAAAAAPRNPPTAAPQTGAPLPDLFSIGNEMFGLPGLQAPIPLPMAPSAKQVLASYTTAPQQKAISAIPKRGTTIKTLEAFAQPFGLTVTATTNGQHAKNSYHYQGRAVDFGGPLDADGYKRMAALADAALSHPQDFREVIYTGPGSSGYSILSGRVIANSKLDKGLYAEHLNHVHLAK